MSFNIIFKVNIMNIRKISLLTSVSCLASIIGLGMSPSQAMDAENTPQNARKIVVAPRRVPGNQMNIGNSHSSQAMDVEPKSQKSVTSLVIPRRVPDNQMNID